MLPLDIDPKLAWALKFRDSFPVDVNRAPRDALAARAGARHQGGQAHPPVAALARAAARRCRAADACRIAKVRPFIVTADWRPTLLTDRADLKRLGRAQAEPARTVRRLSRSAAMLRDGPMIDAHRVTLAAADDFEGWRDAARDLAEAGVPPEAVVWQVEGGQCRSVWDAHRPRTARQASRCRARSSTLARDVICHSDPERFALLYAMLCKLRGNRHAMEDRADPLVDRLERLAKDVRRDVHKMHAFVRFREVDDGEGSRFVAFFEPDHHIVRRNAGFFVRRFANMRWSILTPEVSIHWDGETLSEGPGATSAMRRPAIRSKRCGGPITPTSSIRRG